MLEGVQVGSYRVAKRIGEGGMGEVWLAEHVTLGRRAALKVLHPQFSSRPDIVKRFFNEARAATAPRCVETSASRRFAFRRKAGRTLGRFWKSRDGFAYANSPLQAWATRSC